MKIIKRNESFIQIELDNGNMISLTEIESGVIQIENVTDLGERGLTRGDFGILIEPINLSTINITPEG